MRVLLALALLAAGPAAGQTAAPAQSVANVKAGVEKWRAGDSAGAVAIWQPFAAAGDADAMFNMGQAYKLGRGVAKDPAQAREWYRRAAMKGHLPAQANLGILLFQAGEKPESMRWLKAAADKGEVRAQYVFGIATFNGDGTPRNLGLAYGYLLRASVQGLSQATSALGNIEPAMSPVDRANGEAVSASLAAGQGVPAALAARPPSMASVRNEVLKSAPPAAAPIVAMQSVVTPPKPQVTVVAGPKPQVTVVAAPKPQPLVQAPPQPQPQPQPQPAQATVKPPTAALAASKANTSLPPQTSDQAAVKTVPGKQPAASDDADADPPGSPAKPVAAPVKQSVAMAAVPPAATPPKPAPVQAAAQTGPAASAAPAKTAVAPLAKPATVAAKSTPAGWRVQLGAFSKRGLADEAWAAIRREQKDAIGTAKPLFDDSGPVVKLQLGPFATKAAARDACAKLAFAGRACFVTGS